MIITFLQNYYKQTIYIKISSYSQQSMKFHLRNTNERNNSIIFFNAKLEKRKRLVGWRVKNSFTALCGNLNSHDFLAT